MATLFAGFMYLFFSAVKLIVQNKLQPHQNCVKEVENHSVQSITKNVLSPDEIFANDPFFNSEPDFGVELKSQVGTYNLAGKQILFHNIM